MAIRAAVHHRGRPRGLAGLEVAIQGLGNVGLPLAGYLHEAGAVLTVADLDPARAEGARRRLGARVVEPEAIHRQPVELFAPCALGGILDDRTIPELRAEIVCGGANNQLAEPRHAALLAAHGILYLPDYLANAGGVIDFHQERIDDSPAAVLAAVGRIETIAAEVLRKAARTGRTPQEVADEIVQARLNAARQRRAPAPDRGA